jgi:hypothetical protein
MPSPTWLDSDSTPRLMSPQQYHHLHDSAACHGLLAPAVPHQHDSVVTSRHCQHCLGSAATSITRGLGVYFSDRQSDSEVHHQALGVKECHSNQWPDSGTCLPTLLTSNRGERVVTNKIIGHSSNQLSHFHNSIFFRVNTYVLLYFQLVNILL